MKFVESILPKNKDDGNAGMWEQIYKETYPKYMASSTAQERTGQNFS